jgi:hypothetical protein
MNDTNLGTHSVPHRKGCYCDECTIEWLKEKNAALTASREAGYLKEQG